MKPLLLMLFAATIAAPPASAAYTEQAGTPPEITYLLRVADGYWDTRDIPTICANTTVKLADLSQFSANGLALGCAIEFDTAYVQREVASIRGRLFNDREVRRVHFARLCAIVVHEEGHNRGLFHDAGDGVMRDNLAQRQAWQQQPHECRVAARRYIPRARRHYRTGF